MAKHSLQVIVLSLLRSSRQPLSISEIARRSGADISPRTLRRWLSDWVNEGVLTRSGTGRATRYKFITQDDDAAEPEFLHGLDDDLRRELLAQVRDLWTHNSTALEGNTLSLGDTHFILEEGLTVSGKPVRDHQEVIGHARAIDLLYLSLNEPLTADIVFALHKAVQTAPVTNIYKPLGAWKLEPNETYAIGPDGEQVFIEYALPIDTPSLMLELIEAVNSADGVAIDNAHETYARIHMGTVHIHPFWDGNGRIARLLANIPLLRAGLPPLTISQGDRRQYIRLLANYQIGVGRLRRSTGVWPEPEKLRDFSEYCRANYSSTRDLVAAAFAVQNRRT
jgi:Fic family protein